MAAMLAREHFERAKEYARASEREILFPIDEMRDAIFRQQLFAKSSDRGLNALLDDILSGDNSYLPKELVKRGQDGQLAVSLSTWKKNKSKYAGPIDDLFSALDSDLTLRGGRSVEVADFTAKRRERMRDASADIRRNLINDNDHIYELAGPQSRHNFENENERQEYAEAEQYFQKIVDRLFDTQALKKFKGRVYLTRSKQANAFVLTSDQGQIMEEYLQSATTENQTEKTELPIFIHTGILGYFETEDEIAALLAHELSHLLQPDYLRKDKTEEQSKRLEYDADLNGLHLLNAAGYNPRGMIKFYNRFNKRGPTGALRVIFSSTHPEMENRILELEKEFHRQDTPLPNASKHLTPLPEHIIVLKDKKLGNDPPPIKPKNVIEAVDEIGKIDDKSRCLMKDTVQKLDEVMNKDLRAAIIDQELAHDTLGYRAVVFAELKALSVAIKIAEATRGETTTKHSLELSSNLLTLIRDPEAEENALLLDLLDLPAQNLYAANSDALEKLRLQPTRREGIIKEVEKLLETHPTAREKAYFRNGKRIKLGDDLEYWLDENNEDTKILWEYIASTAANKKTTLSRPERLRVIHNFILALMHENPIIFTLKKRYQQKYKERVKKQKKSSRLDNVPLALRASKIQDDEYEEVEQTRAETEVLFLSRGYELKLATHPLSPSSQHPPLTRPLAEIYGQKTIEAYREILEKDGFKGELDDETLRFILERLFIGDKIKQLRPSDNITFFHKVIKILEQKSFYNFFHGQAIALNENDYSFTAELATMIAMVFKPRNDEEREIQNEYLRRLESDPILAAATREMTKKDKMWLINKEGEPDRTDIDYEFLFESRDRPGVHSLSSARDIVTISCAKRLWSEHSRELLAMLEDESQTEEAAGPISAYLDPTDTEYKISHPRARARKKTSPEITDKHWLKITRAYLQYALFEQLPDSKSLEQFLLDWPNGNNVKMFLKPWVEASAAELNLPTAWAWDIWEKDTGGFKDMLEKMMLERINSGKTPAELFRKIHRHSRMLTAHTETGKAARQQFYLYAPKNERHYEAIEKSFRPVLQYLQFKAQKDKNFTALYKIVKKYADNKTKIPAELIKACYGHMPEFKFYREYSHAGEGEPTLPCQELIAFWKALKDVYGDEWRNFEQSKRFEEQMSLWEWLYDNPFDSALIQSFDKKYGRQLEDYYRIDKANINGYNFSWPLFLEDIWSGTFPFDKIFPEGSGQIFISKEIIAEAPAAIEGMRAFLENIVNTNNLDAVARMQPGFFREFILDKKIKKIEQEQGRKFTLEELEEHLKLFSQHTHEASTRNQITVQIENVRFGIVKERKDELMERAKEKILTRVVTLPENVYRSEGDVWYEEKLGRNHVIFFTVIHVWGDHYSDLTDSGYEIRMQNALVYDKERKKQIVGELSDGFQNEILPKVRAEYYQSLLKEKNECAQMAATDENQVFVYSDQVIENEKSKIEVGPIYRLRYIAQPLMDWHMIELDAFIAGARKENFEKTYARIEKNLGEAHPLRDLYLQNQLAVELWKYLEHELGKDRLGELGITISKTEIDLKDVLARFPLQYEMSFLKLYAIYEISGLEKAAEKLSAPVAAGLLEKIEKTMTERFSEQGRPILRRLLMALEAKTRWPQLKEDRNSNPEIFDQYLKRILNLMPDATWERDEILESIMMDLARTPDQIRQVWNLRYAEQVRWPKEGDKAEKIGQQFQAFEKTRAMMATLDAGQRRQYLLWIMGAEAPLAEAISVQKTGIALKERKNLIWKFGPTERKQLLYELLAGGKQGVFNYNRAESQSYSPENHWQLHLAMYPDDARPWPVALNAGGEMKYFTDSIFELTFKDQLIDPDKPAEHESNVRGRKLIKLIFTELFIHQPDAARQTELLIKIIEVIGALKKGGEELTPGRLIRLLLEQIGVVGIKVGQILSEQPELLPEAVRAELRVLKDSTEPFSKRGSLAYYEAAGWVASEDSKIENIGEIMGSASIKQVRKNLLRDGQEVASKEQHPSIAKNFAEQIDVLRAIIKTIQAEGYKVPAYLLGEAETLIKDELSFTRERSNQLALGRALSDRNAQIPLTIGIEQTQIPLTVSAPLVVGEVMFPDESTTEDIGLMIEELARGLSLKEVADYQTALTADDKSAVATFRKRVAGIYDRSRIDYIESRVRGLDIKKLRAALGAELLAQITGDGIFHADLHEGNFILDFTPFAKDGELHEARGIFIDNGSVGYSLAQRVPETLKDEFREDFDARADFGEFILSLATGNLENLAMIINRHTGLLWDSTEIERLSAPHKNTKDKINAIFYGILEKSSAKIQPQLRYLFKALATAAGHLDEYKKSLFESMAN